MSFGIARGSTYHHRRAEANWEAALSTLVVAAYPPELRGLFEQLPASVRGRIETRSIGIGLVDAAAGIERALAEARPARLLLCGTAGALPGSGLHIGDLVVAEAARLVVRPAEYVPAAMPTHAAADAALSASLARAASARRCTVASATGITRDDAEAARLAGEAQVEHLESFAVLRAAARAGVPATALLGIANQVGASAAAEWRQHHAAVEAQICRALAALLDGGW